MKDKNKKVFISYSWSDMKIANEIEDNLSRLQLELIRDVRDIEYKSSISDFMETIRGSDFAILLISDSYLRSKNCMKEVLHLLKDRDYEDKILPVLVSGTKIYSPQDRIEYTKYWFEQKEQLTNMIGALPTTAVISEYKELQTVETIFTSMNDFLSYLSDKKNLTFEELKEEGYASVISSLGAVNVTHLVKLMQISFIEDAEEKEIKLDDWIDEHKPTAEAYSIRASIARDKGNIKKAEANYEKALKINDKNAFVLNDYGYMLLQLHMQHKKAKALFEKAIEYMPTLTEARLNLGVLLSGDHFSDYNAAKVQYETIISYNPTEERAYNNLTNYYKTCCEDNQETREIICELYEKTLSLNPDYLEAHMGYGSYLSENLNKHELALRHYNEMVRINPKSSELVKALKSRVARVKKLRSPDKQPRNELCKCGSGKKYKKCHGA
ncbi:TIR domain-containing protein [Vibrio harveyi]|nr:TIR domain-containing protein [Vibrio harveyi]